MKQNEKYILVTNGSVVTYFTESCQSLSVSERYDEIFLMRHKNGVSELNFVKCSRFYSINYDSPALMCITKATKDTCMNNKCLKLTNDLIHHMLYTITNLTLNILSLIK